MARETLIKSNSPRSNEHTHAAEFDTLRFDQRVPRQRGANLRTLVKMHPAVCLLYLVAIMGMTAFSANPVTALESLCGAILLAALSGGVRGAGWFAGIAAAAALANFLFVHKGVTVLFFVGDTAFTLEALIYGVILGIILAAVCMWGVCSVKFITSDKYIWLFGRILPSAGLVLSCAVRFVPLFIRRTREFIAVQEAQTVRGYLRAFSASLGYSAERAMDSALSMKARGYGTARRTSFSLYRFTAGALAALCVVLIAGGLSLTMMICGAGKFYFYPALSELPAGVADIVYYSVFGIFCLLPSAVFIRRN